MLLNMSFLGPMRKFQRLLDCILQAASDTVACSEPCFAQSLPMVNGLYLCLPFGGCLTDSLPHMLFGTRLN